MSIAVLISGGVDSAVVVHQLKEQGEDLHLFYIRIGMDNDEGDFSPDEVQAATTAGFIPVTLGESRLRTETAGLMAVAAIHALDQSAKFNV